ncbi:MAG TPA: TetR family transcriptional regulator [Acidimicrobiales bacterium]|nr:TetR family transcriptional regulator [Acidimicrobiales bacterium]
MSQTLAIDGRPLGRRAQETRRRLLDATYELVQTNGIRDVRVVEVARRVGSSPATFYQYFRDVDEAVLVLADEAADEIAPIAALLDEPWNGKGGLETARALVDAYFRFWDDHRAVMRVRNLAADEGDRRFRDVRNRALGQVTDRMARNVAENQRAGRVPPEITPYSAAAAMVSMLERMASYHFDLEPRGVTRADLVETTARILHHTVTGRKT